MSGDTPETPGGKGGGYLNRTIKKQFWLSVEEDELLKEKAGAVCLTEAALIRMLIRGFAPKEKPGMEFYRSMHQIAVIGENLNQIVRRAHTLGFVDVNRLNHEMETLRAFRLAMEKKYLEPEEIAGWR